MNHGLFITFEGIDGVGKTTQALLLKERLVLNQHPVLHTVEPGGTRLGKSIRTLVLNPEYSNMHFMTEILLLAADRAQHVNEVITPALRAGQHVICERFVDSSIAYQGYGFEYDIEAILAVNKLATDGLTPDITIFLDKDPQDALSKTKGDRIEQRDLEYYRKVRQGFLRIKEQEPERFVIVSALGSVQEVSDRVYQSVLRRFKA